MPAEEQKLNVLYQLGQEIKDKREELGLTLEDVEGNTHVRVEYLEGLESGDYRILPDTVYVLGFIRTYLKFIKLSELYPEFSHWLKKSSKTAERNQEVIGQYAPPPPGFKLASRFWLFTVLALTIVGAMTYVAYSWSKHGVPDINSRNEPVIKQEVEQPKAIPAAAVVSASVSPDKETPREEIPPPVVPKVPAQKPELRIRAIDECWLSVRMGSKNEQMTLKKGSTFAVELTEMARVTYGRPWDVVVTLNGKDIGSPYTGGVRKTQVNYYGPDGKTGKIEPTPKPRT